MKGINRKEKILEILYKVGEISVKEISNSFNVSQETIRRDLTSMENEGLILKTHGGAVLNLESVRDISVDVRKEIFLTEKRIIAKNAVSFIENGDIIMLDSSTTCLEIAKKLKKFENLTVITNSLIIASEISRCTNIKLILIGGVIFHEYQCFFGSTTEKALQELFANKAFISCSSLDLENGITDSNENECALRKIMIKNSKKVFLCADHTKINKVAMCKITNFSDIDYLITNEILDSNWESFLLENKVKFNTKIQK